MSFKVPFIKPNFPPSLVLARDLRAIVKRNWYTNFGPLEREFCSRSASFIGGNVHATTIANATLGLDSAVSLLFHKDKKIAIIPSFTFAAGPEILINNGYSPLLIDIDKKSLQPNFQQAEKIITDSPGLYAGILLTNTFGVGNKDVRKWEKLSRKFNIPLVIDSAAGFGSSYSEREKVGNRGDCEVFSLHATKPFSVGEGGLVVSKNKDLIAKVRSWQNFGFESDHVIHRIGTNAKFQEVNAAIALRQLRNYNNRLTTRQKNLEQYKKILEPIGLSFQVNDNLSSVAFVTVMFKSKEDSEKAIKLLIAKGVEARKYYAPLHHQDNLKQYLSDRQPLVPLTATDEVFGRVVSLPLHDNMHLKTIDYIGEVIKDALSS